MLVDGICPYAGPGVIFETTWDTSGVLRLLYNDESLSGDVIRQNTVISDKGIITYIYGWETFYPFNENLHVFNFSNQEIYKLNSYNSARKYINNINIDHNLGCPGREGKGAKIF